MGAIIVGVVILSMKQRSHLISNITKVPRRIAVLCELYNALDQLHEYRTMPERVSARIETYSTSGAFVGDELFALSSEASPVGDGMRPTINVFAVDAYDNQHRKVVYRQIHTLPLIDLPSMTGIVRYSLESSVLRLDLVDRTLRRLLVQLRLELQLPCAARRPVDVRTTDHRTVDALSDLDTYVLSRSAYVCDGEGTVRLPTRRRPGRSRSTVVRRRVVVLRERGTSDPVADRCRSVHDLAVLRVVWRRTGGQGSTAMRARQLYDPELRVVGTFPISIDEHRKCHLDERHGL